MSDKYYRGLRNSLNNTKYKLQLASMSLKINENENIINKMKSDISDISDLTNFSEKINTNKNYISSNSGKINDNEINISNNLGKINTNDNDIDEMKSNLNNIKNDLSDFKINKNISNYSIQNLFIFDIDVENNYTLNKDNPKFSIFNYNLDR